MNERELLPNRRLAETSELNFRGHKITVTTGYYADGRLGEVFADAGKVGSELECTARDATVAISFALQHGASLAAIGRAMMLNHDGTPASMAGAIVHHLEKLPLS